MNKTVLESSEVLYESSGGAVRLGKALYVERSADADLVKRLRDFREIFVITAPRQSGKTSLWNKTQNALKDEKFNFCTLDFREVFGSPEESTRTHRGWSETLLRAMTRAYKLDLDELGQWLMANSDLPMTNLITEFHKDFLRSRLKGPIIVAFDEIDVVQQYHHFTDAFFEAIRAMASIRDKLDMSFVLIGINRPEDLLKVVQGAGFNIHTHPFVLRDFDADNNNHVSLWAEGYPVSEETVRLEIAKAILAASGGQPFVTACLFSEAYSRNLKTVSEVKDLIDEMVQKAMSGDWLASHFDSPRDFIVDHPNNAYRIIETYEQARKGPLVADKLRREIRAALLTSGLVHPAFNNEKNLVIKSPIYSKFFDNGWIERLKVKLGSEVFVGQMQSGSIQVDRPDKRICIINTGGMISTEIQPDGKSGIPADLTRFFQRFPELNQIAQVEAIALMAKDSSDMNPDDWKAIAEAIFSRRFQGFDGFVVAHGTDTLPHTASAVAFALGEGLSFPVVFVGSQVGPHVIHGDARINLMRAATVATNPIEGVSVPEVVAVVGDQIHRGVRVEKKDDSRFDGLHSPTWRTLGQISDDVDIPSNDVRAFDTRREMELRNEFSRKVFKIGLYPGLDPSYLLQFLDIDQIDGVIIETLGIGNVPTEGKWSLIPFIEQATALNIPVLLASQFPIQPRMTLNYEPAGPPLAAGAIAALNMSPPAAVTKFMWVLPQVQERISQGLPQDRKIEEIRKMMSINYVGELDEKPELRK